ncbi:hypothetical protein CTI12_AA368880 [Artemisia annua]|uniref:Uncharacterized protein n=1 Tax=Artemisia annua TaxID=35608 RepID=A0A2U1MH94_ARTAN|nr:hypothetical protein CTI12_AA368880 [Artemisia annua]
MAMMIAIIIMLLFVKVSVLMTTNAAFFLHTEQIQVSHDLEYDHQHVHSPGLSRKLMPTKKVEGYGDQDLVFYNDQTEPLLGESRKTAEEVMVIGAQGSDSTHFTTMDYSHVRRRRPIHNNSHPKTNISP